MTITLPTPSARAQQAAADRIAQLDLGSGVEPTWQNIAAAFQSGWLDGNDLASILQETARDAVLADRAQIHEALQTGQAVPGIRTDAVPSVSALIDAYAAYDGEVDTFVHEWQGYFEGRDTPCPDSDDGLHYVTSGSCDMCGDNNRN